VIVTRFRCGNERENKYWNEDRIRVVQDVWRKKGDDRAFVEWMRRIERERDESREEMLNEDGRGIEWMKNVEWRRRTICGEG
jgi:erythromycin esterase-like protein